MLWIPFFGRLFLGVKHRFAICDSGTFITYYKCEKWSPLSNFYTRLMLIKSSRLYENYKRIFHFWCRTASGFKLTHSHCTLWKARKNIPIEYSSVGKANFLSFFLSGHEYERHNSIVQSEETPMEEEKSEWRRKRTKNIHKLSLTITFGWILGRIHKLF